MKGELVKFKNSEGLFLDGMYFASEDSKKVIIHIHRGFGNFYSNYFIKERADVYVAAGFSFLTFNLTQHGGIAEAVRKTSKGSSWEYVGYAISSYDSCIDDIKGAIDFVKKCGNERIILQGHSLGCNRVIHFCNCVHNSYEVVLLSPTDSMQIQEKWIFPEKIETQILRLQKKANKKEILFGEHGVYTKDMEIDKSVDNIPYIPVSANSLISLLSNPSFNFVNTLEQSGKVQNQAFIYYGNKDEYQTWPVEKYEHIFINHFKDAYFFIVEEGNHSFQGYERKVCNEIIAWLKNERKGRDNNENA